ncbi:MAG: hypothetical protein AMJ61_09420 [Desulfobacterales bacterium SG8_35_2]|nr:MAG: hypothetical protein AMJ61_09420 [Desulfobacterales bacterium SG8_35_2]
MIPEAAIETAVANRFIVISPPVRSESAAYNPPGRPELAFDLLVMSTNKSFPLFKNLLPLRL